MKLAVVVFINLVLFSALENYNAEDPGENQNNAELDVDLWEDSDDLENKFPAFCSGFDDTGRPIWIIQYGKWDLKSIATGVSLKKRKAFDEYFDGLWCRIQKSIKIKDTKEKPVKEWAGILDMDGYSNRQLSSVETVSYNYLLTKKFEKAARNMGYSFLINMDSIAHVLVGLLKPFLGTSLKRMDMYKKDKDKYLLAILKRIPKGSLPKQYGGYANFTAYPVDEC